MHCNTKSNPNTSVVQNSSIINSSPFSNNLCMCMYGQCQLILCMWPQGLGIYMTLYSVCVCIMREGRERERINVFVQAIQFVSSHDIHYNIHICA